MSVKVHERICDFYAQTQQYRVFDRENLPTEQQLQEYHKLESTINQMCSQTINSIKELYVMRLREDEPREYSIQQLAKDEIEQKIENSERQGAMAYKCLTVAGFILSTGVTGLILYAGLIPVVATTSALMIGLVAASGATTCGGFAAAGAFAIQAEKKSQEADEARSLLKIANRYHKINPANEKSDFAIFVENARKSFDLSDEILRDERFHRIYERYKVSMLAISPFLSKLCKNP